MEQRAANTSQLADLATAEALFDGVDGAQAVATGEGGEAGPGVGVERGQRLAVGQQAAGLFGVPGAADDRLGPEARKPVDAGQMVVGVAEGEAVGRAGQAGVWACGIAQGGAGLLQRDPVGRLRGAGAGDAGRGDGRV